MNFRKRFFSALLTLALLCGIGTTAPLAIPQSVPSLGQASGEFDKNARSNITFAIHWSNATEITAIHYGEKALARGEDYTISEDKLTVKKEFLFTQPLGASSLTVTFNDTAQTRCSREISVRLDAQVWIHTLHPWLRFLADDKITINDQAAYNDFVEFLTDTKNWNYVAQNIDVISFFAVTTGAAMSDEVVVKFCDMVKAVNSKRAAQGKGRLQIAFEVGGILSYQGAGAKGSREETYYWFEQEALGSAMPRMKAQGVYVDYINFDGTISRATGNQAAATGKTPSPQCPVMSQAQAISEIVHLMQIYQEYYADVAHDVKFNYLFNFPNHGWKGARAITFDGSGYGDAYADLLALDAAAKTARVPLLGFVLDSPYNYRNAVKDIDALKRCLEFETEATARGYTTGIVFNSEVENTRGDKSKNFYNASLQFIEAYEKNGGKPNVYICESWYPSAPATHLPENKPYALTNLAKAFIDHVKFGVPVQQLPPVNWLCYARSFCELLWESIFCNPCLEYRQPATPVAEEPAYPLDRYVREAYLKPIWEGGVVYQESVMPLEQPDGSVQDIPLLYAADKILSVRSSDLRREYIQGVDYALVDGRLRVLGGTIPRVPWNTLYPAQEFESPPGSLLLPGKTSNVPWLWIEGGSLFHSRQLSVTYQHSDAYTGKIPPRQGGQLPKTLAKLETGAPLRVLVYGDSIAVGAQSSGWCGVEPNTPAWYELFADDLQDNYDSDVTVINTSVGNAASGWGAENAADLAANQYPDLAVIAFGMNDGSGGIKTIRYILNTLKIMARVRAQNPNCEFVLVATTLPNPLSTMATGRHEIYRPQLLRLAQQGVAVADMTSVHQDILSRKRFEDCSANNSNHPNDFLARVYAQVLLETLRTAES
ncbi:MAG: GDSL-type esterase/lipase family protein [Oscillospiraceae bacterium]|jgi:lysophospholipase L1-like esterase|nr:GDSL-type esterase/lipase family protein [Oscillospiraceae bacterium]